MELNIKVTITPSGNGESGQLNIKDLLSGVLKGIQNVKEADKEKS